MFDRLGNILRDRLNTDEDPFETDETFIHKTRQAANTRTRTPPPLKSQIVERVPIPDELINDYTILGLPSGTSLNECKTRWKKLLKQYHPDSNSLNSLKTEDTTQKVIAVTRSWRRISHWFQTGQIL